MTSEQREEIENAIKDLEDSKDIGVIDSLTWPEISTLIQFARQQLSLNSNSLEFEEIKTGLNLRVDGEKFRENFKVSFERHWSGANYSLADIPEDPDELSRRVLECITATPEEKE